MMEKTDKDRMLLSYIQMLYGSGRSYDIIGRYIRSVMDYLESVEEVNRKSYKDYVKNNAEKIVSNDVCKEALCVFLDFAGVGFNRKKKERKEVPLEKLNVLSDKNRKQINEFMSYLQQDYDYSQNTLYLYYWGVNNFFQYANEFSTENCRRFIKTLEEKGFSPKTIRLRITALERFGKFIKKPVTLKRPKLKKELSVENIPTEEEYERLLSYLAGLKNRDYYFFIKILATTGARCSEFLQITWEDIMNGEKVMKGKGNKYRRFFFNKNLMKEVGAYMRETGKTGYVATGRFGKLTDRGLSQHMKVWADKCGIDRKKMHPHAFRHFFAKMFLKKNKDVVQLADLMGHGSVDTTRIYLQKSYDEQKKEFNRCVVW